MVVWCNPPRVWAGPPLRPCWLSSTWPLLSLGRSFLIACEHSIILVSQISWGSSFSFTFTRTDSHFKSCPQVFQLSHKSPGIQGLFLDSWRKPLKLTTHVLYTCAICITWVTPRSAAKSWSTTWSQCTTVAVGSECLHSWMWRHTLLGIATWEGCSDAFFSKQCLSSESTQLYSRACDKYGPRNSQDCFKPFYFSLIIPA